MSKVCFPVPATAAETIELLEQATSFPAFMLEFANGWQVGGGDQGFFIGDNRAEAEAFLAGWFYATFVGLSVESIRELVAGKIPGSAGWQGLRAEVKRAAGKVLRDISSE